MRPEILFPLFAEVTTLKGVGAKVAPQIRKVAGPLVRDLLFLAPTGLIHRRATTADQAMEGEVAILDVVIDRHIRPHKIGAPWKVRASDPTGFVHLIWFRGGPHLERLVPSGERRVVSGKVEIFNNEIQILHPDVVKAEAAGDIPSPKRSIPPPRGWRAALCAVWLWRR